MLTYNYVYMAWSFPGGSSDKESTCQCWRHKRHGFDPWVGKIPWRRKWQPTPVFLQKKSRDKGAWQATVHGSQRVGHDWASEPQALRGIDWNSFCHCLVILRQTLKAIFLVLKAVSTYIIIQIMWLLFYSHFILCWIRFLPGVSPWTGVCQAAVDGVAESDMTKTT